MTIREVDINTLLDKKPFLLKDIISLIDREIGVRGCGNFLADLFKIHLIIDEREKTAQFLCSLKNFSSAPCEENLPYKYSEGEALKMLQKYSQLIYRVQEHVWGYRMYSEYFKFIYDLCGESHLIAELAANIKLQEID